MIYKTRYCDVRMKSQYFIKASLYRSNILKIILGIININVIILLNFIEYKIEIIYTNRILYSFDVIYIYITVI
jgi:hypothetical protein